MPFEDFGHQTAAHLFVENDSEPLTFHRGTVQNVPLEQEFAASAQRESSVSPGSGGESGIWLVKLQFLQTVGTSPVTGLRAEDLSLPLNTQTLVPSSHGAPF